MATSRKAKKCADHILANLAIKFFFQSSTVSNFRVNIDHYKPERTKKKVTA
jgi:hypothetical protein